MTVKGMNIYRLYFYVKEKQTHSCMPLIFYATICLRCFYNSEDKIQTTQAWQHFDPVTVSQGG